MLQPIKGRGRVLADGQTYFLILLVLSVGVSLVCPVTFLSVPYTYLGASIVGLGLGLGFWCRSLFIKSKTTLSPFESPSVLLTSGPFRFSRNPIYLAMALMLLGVAVLLGAVAALIFPVIFIVAIELRFIPLEERKLEAIFGEEYREYRRKVRRWL